MGPQEDYIETVVTCEGDFHDPHLQDRLQSFQQRLESLLLEDGKKQLILKKVEPWNSVRVTFNIPREAALRLKQLAEQGSAVLRQMGVLGVQIEGDRLVSLTVATPNNQRAELIIQTHDGPGQGPAQPGTSVSLDPGLPSSSDELGSPGPNMEVTRKNIEEYLRQGSIYNSIFTPSTGAAGPSGAGTSGDVFKTPPSDGGPFRINNIVSEGVSGPSGMSAFSSRSAFPLIAGSGTFTPPLSAGGHGRVNRKGSVHNAAHQHQQLSSQATALPQTAALSYSMMGLPPPPPYPHRHGPGVVNNVSRQGKKVTPSSPLLINLLQTEPMAGSNNVMATSADGEKPKKKRRRRKEKVIAATSTSDGQLTTQNIHNLPLDSDPTPNGVPPQSMSSAEEMSAVLHRHVPPVPLPAPKMTGFSSSHPSASDTGSASDSYRDRSSAASAALASLAQSQRSSLESEQFSGDSIINPYTGHLEPRDSASDLSPVKNDQHKTHSDSLLESSKETVVSPAISSPPVSLSAAKTDIRTGSGDCVHLGLGHFHSGATVPSSLREELERGFPSSGVTSLSTQTHSMATDTLVGQRPDVPRTRVTTASSANPANAAAHIYAQQNISPSQALLWPPHSAPQHLSSSLLAGNPSVNGPNSSAPHSATNTVSSIQLSSGQEMPGAGLEGPGTTNTYHMPSCRPQPSSGSDLLHNMSVGGDGRVGEGGSVGTKFLGSEQSVTVTNVQPVKSKIVPVTEMQHGAASPIASSAQPQNDSLKLLNSSSPALGTVQRLATESASTSSPAGSKPPSDGDDNSNHSGTSPVGQPDGTAATSSLLDASGSKADNHDSGVGSSSERSEDTTPSEVGDGEFQTGVATSESSALDSSGSKSAVGVARTVVNCRKEAPGSGDSNTITIGYVQVNQHTTDLYSKEMKKHIVGSSSLIDDKAAPEVSLHHVSHHIKSGGSLVPLGNHVALTVEKDLEVSLAMPAKASSPQQQRLLLKQKANQVSSVHHNGPMPMPTSLRHQHFAGHLANSSHAALHHPTGGSISHNHTHPGLTHPPTSASNSQAVDEKPGSGGVSQGLHHASGTVSVHHPAGNGSVNQAFHHPSGNVLNSHGHAGQHHLQNSVSSNLVQGVGHPVPASHSAGVERGLFTGAASSGLSPGAATSQVQGHRTNNSVSAASVSSAHSSHGASALVFRGATQNTSTTQANSQGQRLLGPSLTNCVGQGHRSAGGVLAHGFSGNVTQRGLMLVTSSQALTTSTSAAQAQHRIGMPSYLGQYTRPGSPGALSHHSHVHASNGSPLSNIVARCSGDKVTRSVPSPIFTAASIILDTPASRISSLSQAEGDKGSSMQPVSSAHNVIMTNSLSSHTIMETSGNNPVNHSVANSVFATSDGGMLSSTLKLGSARLVSSNSASHIISKSAGHVSSELITAGAVNEMELMDPAYPPSDSTVFDNDLALATEPGLSAFIDIGARHAATNGTGSISAETRGGSNITSMYTKRSSPINVNMLNHMYAAGLPQPRRLTESVQRLVKPLPNPENSLPAGRTCKSPGASSSRHSSNGSISPGRANQGGARSPGASVSGRNLCFDKMTPSPSSAVNSSNVGGGSGFSSALHTAQSSLGGATVNCINTSVIPPASHQLTTVQTTSHMSRTKTGGFPAGQSINHDSQTTSTASSSSSSASVVMSSSSAPDLASSLLPTTVTLIPHSALDAIISSHASNDGLVLSHDSQLPAHNHSMGSLQFPTSVSSTGPHPPLCHPTTVLSIQSPLPALVKSELSREAPYMGRVPSPAMPAVLDKPIVVSAVSSHAPGGRLTLPAVPPYPHSHINLHSHRPSVSVCNTSPRIDSDIDEISPSLTFSSSLSPLPSASLSPVTSASTVTQQQQQGLSASTTAANCVVSTIPFSLDLSTHTVVTSAGQTYSSNCASGSVCGPSMLAATTLTYSPVMPKPVTVSHIVTPNCQEGLTSASAVSSSVVTMQNGARLGACVKTTASPNNLLKNNNEKRTEHNRQLDPPHKQSSADSPSSDCSSYGVPMPVLSSLHSAVIQGDPDITVTAMPTVDQPVILEEADPVVTKPDSLAENWSQSQESIGKDMEEGGMGQSTVSVSPMPGDDFVHDIAQAETLHSKPPLLHPAAPLTVPTHVQSSTPPPPPLTPVLLQDCSRKEPHHGQNTPPLPASGHGHLELLSSIHLTDRFATVSPLSIIQDPVAGYDSDSLGMSTDIDSLDDKGIAKDALGNLRDIITSETIALAETEELKSLASELSSADPSNNLKPRRFTRKRRSTHSESDGSSELAPKLSCVENVTGSGLKGAESSRISTSSDHPPKLQREGKKSNVADKKEEEKSVKKEEERAGKKEEEKAGKKGEEKTGQNEERGGGKTGEERGGSKNMSHHDRNILDATPEEIAKKMEAAATGGKRRLHYAYVPEKSLNQSYFDTPVLTGRTRSQGSKGHKETSSAATSSAAPISAVQGTSHSLTTQVGMLNKEDTGDAATGAKRSTRSLRTKDAGESGQAKRKRSKEHR